MKIKVSYFYQVRFFKPNQIPLSTAVWDPQWFHEFKNKNHTFIDKNGVINGLRIEEFSPKDCDGMCYGTKTDKRGKGCTEDPNTCLFIQAYRNQLNKLDFDNIMRKLENICEKYNGSEIILLVHEATNNPCSERKSIIEFFNMHGIDCEEFKKE